LPAKLWWLEFRSFTSFEKPTVLVKSDGKHWNAYISGISSARFDRVNTPIRYSLVLEGAAREEDVYKAIKLVAACVADAASPAKPSELQVELDTVFTEEIVEGLLGDRSTTAVKETDERLRTAISRLAKAPRTRPAKARHEQNVPADWVGGIQAEACRAAFLDRVETLLNGGAGAALMVNLVGIEEEASTILDKQPAAAVLLVDPALSFKSQGFVPLKKKNLTQMPDRGSETISPKIGQTRNIFLTTVIILGAITLLAWGLHYSYKSTPDDQTKPSGGRSAW
jgi:hypothetical protein